VTCTETAKAIRLHQLELASNNRSYEVKDVVEMHSIVKKYKLKKEEAKKLKTVEANYGYKQPRDKDAKVEITLQLTHKWGEHDYEKKLIALQEKQEKQEKLLSLAIQIDSKDIKLANKQKWDADKAFQAIKNQLEQQGLTDIWTLDNSIGNIITARGNTAFKGWILQNPVEFPDIGVLIWQQSTNNVLKFNIYTVLLPNHLVIKQTKDTTSEALCIKNQEDPFIESFISSVIALAHDSIEEMYKEAKGDFY
jgi:hypothetical protein